jgi:hypothetical protein
MQNAFTQALPNAYSKIDRTPLIKRFEQIMYGPKRIKGDQSFTRDDISGVVKQVLDEPATRQLLIAQAVGLMRKHYQETRSSRLLSEEDVAQKYGHDIKEKCSGEPRCIDTFYAPHIIAAHFNYYNDSRQAELMAQEQQAQARNHEDDVRRFLSTPPAPQPTPPTVYDAPPTSPSFLYAIAMTAWSILKSCPSLPSDTNAPSYTPDACCPTDECFCTNQFSSITPSFFLHCGHNFCKDCLEEWLLTNYKSTCPNCRATISTEEKSRLRNAFETENTCVLCNSNTQVIRLLQCSHYICAPCKNKWINSNSGFSSRCPRCFK